jgi:hypothetical protein
MFHLDIYMVFILLATLAPGIVCAGLWRFPNSPVSRSYNFAIYMALQIRFGRKVKQTAPQR